MAIANGTFTKVKPNEIKTITQTAVDATDGIKFTKPLDGYLDEDVVLIATNTNTTTAKTVTLVAPTDGSYASADSNVELSVAASSTVAIRIESAKYANNDGSIVVKGGSTDVKVAAIYR